MEIKEGLTFDDVLLQPKYSEITSRSSVDLSVRLPKRIRVSHPIVPANMATVTGQEMAECIAKSGGLAILHRFMPFEEQMAILNELDLTDSENEDHYYLEHTGFSIGVKKEDYEYVDNLVSMNAHIICIDIAHGDSKSCVEMCRYISEKYPDVLLIAGNVATGEGAKRLWLAGADFVKVGVGPGSLCTTRIETGNGVPQLTALIDVANMKNYITSTSVEYDYIGGQIIPRKPEITRPIGIIADGGLKNAGDCVKALAFADLVMAGNLFAGAAETPGNTIIMDGMKYKEYVGSSTHKANHIEGVSALVPQKGPVQDILTKLLEGIKSGCSYQGVSNLTDLKKDPQFVRITNAGLKESHPHSVIVKG